MPHPTKPILTTAALLTLTAATSAAEIGSALINRPFADASGGVLPIYVGARIPAGHTVTTVSWFRSPATNSVTLTPLLLEETAPGLYRLRAIGTPRAGSSTNTLQSAPFAPIAGSAVIPNASYVFGFIGATVSAAGAVTAPTIGPVMLDTSVTPGQGLSGPDSTNRWIFCFNTINSLNINTTTFGLNVGATFPTNNPGLVGFFLDRTYSASITTTPPPSNCPGDLNSDGVVNTADLIAFLGRFGQPATPGSPAQAADLNNDGVVNTADLILFLGRFGNVCA